MEKFWALAVNLRDPNGEYKYIFVDAWARHTIFITQKYVKLDFISGLMSKVWQSRFFLSFLPAFLDITVQIFMVEKTFIYINVPLIKPYTFHFSEFRCDNFLKSYREKKARIVKFTYNLRFFFKKSPENIFFQQNVHVKRRLMMKTKTIAKGKYFGSPATQRDSLVIFQSVESLSHLH